MYDAETEAMQAVMEVGVTDALILTGSCASDKIGVWNDIVCFWIHLMVRTTFLKKRYVCFWIHDNRLLHVRMLPIVMYSTYVME